MPRTNPTRKPQIDEQLCRRVDAIAARYAASHMSFNQMTELLIEQMCDLVESTAKDWTVPPVAVAIDANRTPRKFSSAGAKAADAAAAESLRRR